LADERPKWLEHNTYWALLTADRYVWCYSERMDWWKTKTVPGGCEEAVRNARSYVNGGERMGFSLEPIVAAAQQRRTEAQKAARYERLARRTSEVAPVSGSSAPVIDGELKDQAWESSSALEPFVIIGDTQTAAKGQTVARATYDTRALYVAVRCEEPNAGELHSEKLSPNDMQIFRGNTVEILINVT